MPDTGRRAKLPPGLLAGRSAAPDLVSIAAHNHSEGQAAASAAPVARHTDPPELSSAPEADAAVGGQNVLGVATALAFQPSSYGINTESEGSSLSPLPVATAMAEAARNPSSTSPVEENTDPLDPTFAAPDARTVEDRETQQALAASLAEIIDDILRSRQFAARGVLEWLCKRPPNPTPPVEQFVSTDAVASALRAELARAKVGAQARLTEPWIDRMLGLVGHTESAAGQVASDAERKKLAN
jgi:hypothetical protein